MTGYLKAIVAALIAGLGALGTALLDDSIVPLEWVGIASTTLIALYGVWQVPNAPKAAPATLTGPTGPTVPTTFTNGGTGSNVRKVSGYQGGGVAPPD